MSNQGPTLSETNLAINLLHWSCILDTVNEVLQGSSSFCVYWSQLVTDRACEKQLASFVCIMSLCSWSRQAGRQAACCSNKLCCLYWETRSRGSGSMPTLTRTAFSIMHVQRRSPNFNEQRAQRPQKEKRKPKTTTKYTEYDVMYLKQKD